MPIAHTSSEVQRAVVQVLSKRSNEICGLRLPLAAGRTQVKVLDATILVLPTVRLPEHCDAMRRLSGRPYYSRLCYPFCARRRALTTRSCADRGAIDWKFAAIEYVSNNLDVAAVNPFACFYSLRPFKKAAQGGNRWGATKDGFAGRGWYRSRVRATTESSQVHELEAKLRCIRTPNSMSWKRHLWPDQRTWPPTRGKCTSLKRN
jgi:hypothetical protein